MVDTTTSSSGFKKLMKVKVASQTLVKAISALASTTIRKGRE